MAKIVLWGVGMLSEVLTYYLEHDSDHEIVAYCVDDEWLPEDPFFHKKPVVSFSSVHTLFPPEDYKALIPIGYKKNNTIREEKFYAMKALGYKCISYVHSSSSCSGTIGENCIILEGNIVQPCTTIGDDTFIWSMAGVGHHTTIGPHCFLASPKIAGDTIIGKNCYFGTNCTIGNGISIGDYALIGAGCVVTKSVSAGSILAVKQVKPLGLKSWECDGLLG